MFPTGALATRTQRKVLRVVAEKNRRYTIAELAEQCHRSEASISRALKHADRYPFIEQGRIQGSKQLTFRLDPDSPYTAAIRQFFAVEHDRERQNGTIPVDVWNLLEDVTNQFEDSVDSFVELFLYGSYATGDYYAGSDIDLLLAHTEEDTIEDIVYEVVQTIGDDRLQVIAVLVETAGDPEDGDIVDVVLSRSPASGRDVLVPLSGAVSP